MTEDEWVACADPSAMLQALRGVVSERKLRLFACACCREVGDLLVDEGWDSIEVTERYADGLATEEDLVIARGAARTPRQHSDVIWQLRTATTQEAMRATVMLPWGQVDPFRAARDVARQVARVHGVTLRRLADQAHLLREIIGDPFRPTSCLGSGLLQWNDGTVPKIVQGIYEERAFGRMPVLADALLDAGCEDEELLQHCRSEGPHVRGCWAVDLLLGKE